MSIFESVIVVFDRIGGIAETVFKRVRILLLLALLAAIYLASQFYAPESPWWWNLVKFIGPVFPVLVWGFVLTLLSQIKQAPDVARELISDDDGLLHNLADLDLKQVSSLRGAYTTLKRIRGEESLGEVMETISGVGVLLNPFFLVLALLTFFGLFSLIFTALLVWVF